MTFTASFALVLLTQLSYALAHPWLESRAVNHRAESIDTANPANLVNLFIGTTGGGHTFPGATLPHGMVKVGMDT
jgi:putative alpha-1,2-mannosidase